MTGLSESNFSFCRAGTLVILAGMLKKWNIYLLSIFPPSLLCNMQKLQLRSVLRGATMFSGFCPRSTFYRAIWTIFWAWAVQMPDFQKSSSTTCAPSAALWGCGVLWKWWSVVIHRRDGGIAPSALLPALIRSHSETVPFQIHGLLLQQPVRPLNQRFP